MLLSQAIPWPLSFITPVLVVALYEMPINQPPLAEFGKNLLATTISVTAVFIFVMLLQPFPLVFICAYSLLVFWLAYLMHKGAPLCAYAAIPDCGHHLAHHWYGGRRAERNYWGVPAFVYVVGTDHSAIGFRAAAGSAYRRGTSGCRLPAGLSCAICSALPSYYFSDGTGDGVFFSRLIFPRSLS